MIALRCNGKRGTCDNLLAYQREDNIVEYENRDGVRILILGVAFIRCRCGHLTKIDPMQAIMVQEQRREKTLDSVAAS